MHANSETGLRTTWTVAYAPYDNPETPILVFVYNGKEGAYMAGYPVRRIQTIDGIADAASTVMCI